MNINLTNAIQQIKDSYIPNVSLVAKNQSIENMYCVGLPENERIQLKCEEVVLFLRRCSYLISSKLIEPIRFYAWIDGQVGQLRFSCISEINSELPFKAKIKEVEIEILVNAFIQKDLQTGLDSDEGKLWVWTCILNNQ